MFDRVILRVYLGIGSWRVISGSFYIKVNLKI